MKIPDSTQTVAPQDVPAMQDFLNNCVKRSLQIGPFRIDLEPLLNAAPRVPRAACVDFTLAIYGPRTHARAEGMTKEALVALQRMLTDVLGEERAASPAARGEPLPIPTPTLEEELERAAVVEKKLARVGLKWDLGRDALGRLRGRLEFQDAWIAVEHFEDGVYRLTASDSGHNCFVASFRRAFLAASEVMGDLVEARAGEMADRLAGE